MVCRHTQELWIKGERIACAECLCWEQEEAEIYPEDRALLGADDEAYPDEDTPIMGTDSGPVPHNIKSLWLPAYEPKNPGLLKRLVKGLWNQVRLPTPTEAGKSDHDALQLRGFGAEDGDYCWEDFHEYLKSTYPIRWFLFDTVRFWFITRIWSRLTDALYWVKCHTLPKYRAYSRIDLRNPRPGTDYKYGWIDQSEVVMIAPFICLRNFVEKELAHEHRPPNDDDPQHKEVMALYRWWQDGFIEEEAECTRLYSKYCEARATDPKSMMSDITGQAWMNYRTWRDEHEQEMLERLIKVRRYLWS